MADIQELTPEEGRALFSKRCHDRLNITAEAFLAAHDAGDYPDEWDRDEILYLQMLLPFARREPAPNESCGSAEIEQMEAEIVRIYARELEIDLAAAQYLVNLEVNKRVALVRHRRRLERMFDAALDEAAEAKADLKRAQEELAAAYAEAHGISLEEARYRVRTRQS